MDQDNTKKRTGQILLISRVISFSMSMMVFLYPILADGMVTGKSGETSAAVTWSMRGLIGAAIVLLLAAKRLACIPLLPALRRYRGSGDPSPVFPAYLLSVIIGQSARQLAATIGIIISIITGRMSWAIVLGLAAFCTMAANWPKRGEMELLLKRE